MTLQTFNGTVWLPTPQAGLAGAPTTAAITIDATSEKVAVVFQAPKTGNIDKVSFGVGAVSGTGVDFTFDCRLETVDVSATPGEPSGTLATTNANATATVGLTADNTIITSPAFTAAHAATVGDLLAVVIDCTAAPATTPSCAIARYAEIDATRWPRKTYGLQDLTGSYAAITSNTMPCLTVGYDDGSYAPIDGVFLMDDSEPTSLSFGNATSTTKNGLRFRIPFPARLSKCWLQADLDGDCSFELTDDAGTLLNTLTGTVDKDHDSATTPGTHAIQFDETVDLEKDTWYRLYCVPATTTNVIMYYVNLGAAGLLDSYDGGQDFHRAHYTSSSHQQETDQVSFMGIGLSAFDDAVGGGGGGGLRLVGRGGLVA